MVSMITDEKRREVAARLRGLDDSVKAEIESRMARLSNKDLAATLVSALGLAVALAGAGFDTRTGGDLWELMAGLIDRPTCRNVGEDREFECSECGMIWYLLDKEDAYSEWAHVRNPPHCPSCACRVVRDAEGA